MFLEQLDDGLHGKRPRLRDFPQDSMQGSGFYRVVKRDGDGMRRRAIMTEPDVAAMLANTT